MDLPQLKKQLERDEGRLPRMYYDPVGKRSIGVGRNLDDVGLRPDERAMLLKASPNRDLHYDRLVLSNDEIVYLLNNDIAAAHAELRKYLPWFDQLDDARQNVLINMSFNMGWPRLSKFQMTLRFVSQGAYALAANAMLQSKWATQVGDRADRLARQMKTGEFK